MSNTVRVYGVGGAGVNIVTQVLDVHSNAPGIADTEFSVIDTSRSNLDKNTDKKIGEYLVPGMDGTGKDRAFAKRLIEPHLDKILQEHPPAQFNIVIFSLSGGTGSVGGPLIIRELINRGIDVVGLAVGNTSNGKEALNSMGGVGTLQGFSKKLKSSMAIEFHWIDKETTMSQADRMVSRSVNALTILNSGENPAMDTKDIHNWLNFHNHTTIPPQLVEFFVNVEDPNEERKLDIAAISTASLLLDKDTPQLELNQPYGCFGWVNAAVREGTKEPRNFHFILTTATLNDMINDVKARVDELNKSSEQLSKTAVIQVEGADDDGFVI